MGLFDRRATPAAHSEAPDWEVLIEDLDANLARVRAERDQARHDVLDLERRVRMLETQLAQQSRRLTILREGPERHGRDAARSGEAQPGLWTMVEEVEDAPERSRYRGDFALVGTVDQLDNLDFLLRLMASAGTKRATVFVDLLVDGTSAPPMEVYRGAQPVCLDEVESGTWFAGQGDALDVVEPVDPEAEAERLEHANAPAARAGSAGAFIEIDFR